MRFVERMETRPQQFLLCLPLPSFHGLHHVQVRYYPFVCHPASQMIRAKVRQNCDIHVSMLSFFSLSLTLWRESEIRIYGCVCLH